MDAMLQNLLQELLKDHLLVKNETLKKFLKRIIDEHGFNIDPNNLDGYKTLWFLDELIKCKTHHKRKKDAPWTYAIVFCHDNNSYAIDANHRINHAVIEKIEGAYSMIVLHV